MSFQIPRLVVFLLYVAVPSMAYSDIVSSYKELLDQVRLLDISPSNQVSGITTVRMSNGGTRNYNHPQVADFKYAAIHNHADHVDTVGLGEFECVLNGHKFKTRHNDYKLVRPVFSSVSKKYQATQDVEYPPVPDKVMQQKDVKGQIREMVKCFKAWRDENSKECDFKKYFKPVLCYIEGTFSKTTGKHIDEPFESDRHFLDARSWEELSKKVRFLSSVGNNDNGENIGLLPSKIKKINSTHVELVQWNYRILCHPVDVPTSHLKSVDQLIIRMNLAYSMKQYESSNSVTFTLKPNPSKPFEDQAFEYGRMDKLMEQIPGTDNYGAVLSDNSCGDTKRHALRNEPLNAAYYHRLYRDKTGRVQFRGQNDPNIFMAKTTQSKVNEIKSKCACPNGKCPREDGVSESWTYAMPLELIYMTPLTKWNPLDIAYWGSSKTPTMGGRNGDTKNPNKAYNGIGYKTFYQSPVQFYQGTEENRDPADTVKEQVGVLDRKGKLHRTVASGSRVVLRNIKGVGAMRQRYVMSYRSADHSTTSKELNALKEVVFDSIKYSHILEPLTESHKKPAGNNAATKKRTMATTKATTKKITQKVTTKKATTKKPTKATTKKATAKITTKATTKKTTTKKPTQASTPTDTIRLTMFYSRTGKKYKYPSHSHVVEISSKVVANWKRTDANIRYTDAISTKVLGHVHNVRVRIRRTSRQGVFNYDFIMCDGQRKCHHHNKVALMECNSPSFSTRSECKHPIAP